MPTSGWKQLLHGAPWFRGPDSFSIAAYSEFIPPPWLGRKPYGGSDTDLFADNDPWGWNISEYEEALELQPGLDRLARQLLKVLVHLGQGEAAHGIARNKLHDNPYWPAGLAEKAGKLKHEHYVTLLPLALSRTQDDKGRLRWTLFGGSDQGPARAFWKSFYTAPGREVPEEKALGFIRQLLHVVYGESSESVADLSRAGFRILPDEDEPLVPAWREDPLPSWTAKYLWTPRQQVRSMKYLLTFRPFAWLPEAIQQAYLAKHLHLLPFPGSLIFWGSDFYFRLQQQLPLATQIPLLHSVARHEAPSYIRVPQSGWMHEPRPGKPSPGTHHGPVRNTFKRTNRWAKVHRDEDELAIEAREEKLLHVLFSTDPDDLGLYGKPMARNIQLYTHNYEGLLDGPRADGAALKHAEHVTLQGGLFGYRFQYPAMRVGRHEIYWHRPLAAYLSSQTKTPTLLPDAPLGYLTGYPIDDLHGDRPVELWPRLLQRDLHAEAIHLFEHVHDSRPHVTVRNVRKLVSARDFFGGRPVPRPLARQLLLLPKHRTLDDWLDALPGRTWDEDRGRRFTEELRGLLEPPVCPAPTRKPRAAPSLTFGRSARRPFEVAYWKTIATLAEGKFVNKDNADCIRDAVTQSMVAHSCRDLEALGDYLLAYYQRTVKAANMTGKALVGDLPFHWRTDFDFPWSDGWLRNQQGTLEERDLIAVIPGRDRRRAVIMADHYDTAYMLDEYDKDYGGKGARLAACGADDNHSATAALMLGAPIFLELSRAGKLACDIWLVHLTGEEFPSDCMGARHLVQQAIQGTLTMRLAAGGERDLSAVRIQGVYVLDMVAHNNDRDQNIFQISPGTGQESLWLAYQAHLANEAWNQSTLAWNQRPARRQAGRGRRSPHSGLVPEVAQHPRLSGQVRLPYDPRSTLFNTDGQIFSDAGIPVVLFMENYDINRSGYHDTHDNMANIDLDYGAGVAAIAIEAVARAATEDPTKFLGRSPAKRRAKT